MAENGFTKKEYEGHIYSVSHPSWNHAVKFGEAVMQTWVVEGNSRVLAIDSPVPEIQGFREYLENEFGKPVWMVNSHGYVDHTGCNGQFEDIWISRRDMPLLLSDGIRAAADSGHGRELPYRVHFLEEVQELDLGQRLIKCIPLPGHTKGSYGFYDSATGSLFSGDAVARRLLYGMSGWVRLQKCLQALSGLRGYDIAQIYSMHDDFALPGKFYEKVIAHITANVPGEKRIWESPVDGRKFIHVNNGYPESDMEYFDMVLPLDRKAEAVKDIDLYRERSNCEKMRRIAPECMVLLKSDGTFPLTAPCEVALYGSGARNTIKGGTGSGDVNTRSYATVESGLENAGFTITTKEWLEAYDDIRVCARKGFISGIKEEAAEKGIPAFILGMGAVMPEPEYKLPLAESGNLAIYVLARVSGEGADRKAVSGDFLLTETEVRDIRWLNDHFDKFLLALNVGGPMDLSPVIGVKNILLLHQLGQVTGDAFADVILGHSYPSGRLASTWGG